jgi:hypothetical protein
MSISSDLLNKLNKINEESSVRVFVPSIGREAKFKPLNIKQQKDLIKTSMDGAISGASLSQVINNIIISNAEEQINFKVYDRYAIAVGLRSCAIKDLYNYKGKEIKLSKVVEKGIKSFRQYSLKDTQNIDFHNIKITLEIPSLQRDIQVNGEFISNVKNQSQGVDYGDILGNLYIYEIIKFIKNVSIEDNNCDFNNISVKDCLSIVENLPVSLNAQIIEFIQATREVENIFIALENGIIEINATFFTRA